jgi:hypothetical protein
MPFPDWIGQIPNDNLTLRDITMPSSHDAGVSHVHNANRNAGWAVGSGGYICQTYDIAGQLNCGARFFDVRFDMRNGVPTTTHETAGSGGWGENAASIFTAIDAHLTAHTREIIIVRVSHTDAEAGRAVYSAQETALHPSRSYVTGMRRNISTVPIGQLRGKAIIAYDSGALQVTNPLKGQHRFGKASNAERGGIVTCGEFPNSNDMAIIDYKSAKRIDEHRNQNCNGHSHGDHLFMLYWQMTGGNVENNTTAGGNPPSVANPAPTALAANNGTHYNLRYLMGAVLWGLKAGQNATHVHTGRANSVVAYPPGGANRYLWAPNIINLDFVNDDVCDQVIHFNRRKLQFAGRWF